METAPHDAEPDDLADDLADDLTDDLTDDAVPLCPGCLRPLPPHAHFCLACGTPITPYATTAPLEQVWAMGWLINRLLERRPGTVAFIGAVLVAAPLVALTLADLVPMIMLAGPSPRVLLLFAREPGALFSLLMTTLFGTCYTLLVVRVTRAYLRPASPGLADPPPPPSSAI